MGRVNFIFAIHIHQPVGNFGEVFERAYERSYRPFLETLARHPTVRWNLHASGPLWEWLCAAHPEFVDRVHAQSVSGQLELLSGGYYEPILASIPARDARGQISELTNFLVRRFSATPRGAWCAERVWEPHLPQLLARAGIGYTFLDDAHFFAAGIEPAELTGSFVSESEGERLTIIPIHKTMRYMIPFRPVSELVALFRKQSEHTDALFVMADDGEKFGLWPGTYDHVYTNGWLEEFLCALETHAEWITTWKAGEYVSALPPRGIVYLPAASYAEMAEWTLPSAAQRSFQRCSQAIGDTTCADEVGMVLRSAFWRGFLYKYREANAMHKKMLRTSGKLSRCARDAEGEHWYRSAERALWAGQCNCAYWHGVFGGLYLPHLREAVYRNLLVAERAVDQHRADRQSRSCRIEVSDYDYDGRDEILVENAEQNWYFAPHRGGSVVLWETKQVPHNLTNVITRRREAYHDVVRAAPTETTQHAHGQPQTIHAQVALKEPGLAQMVWYDWHDRLSFLDHCFHPRTTLEGVQRSNYGEQGNFVLAHYQWKISEEDASPSQISLCAHGAVWMDQSFCPMRIHKEFTFHDGGRCTITYELRNESAQQVSFLFGSELNLLLDMHEARRDEQIAQEHTLQASGGAVALRIAFGEPVRVWRYPIETISQSEEGFERTVQGVCVIPVINVGLSPGAVTQFSFQLLAEQAVRA